VANATTTRKRTASRKPPAAAPATAAEGARTRSELEGQIEHLRGCLEADRPLADVDARTELFEARRPASAGGALLNVARCIACGGSAVEEQ
jgi:hypothetical protein